MASTLKNLVNNLFEPHKNLSIDILKQRFPNTYQLCNDNIDKFELLLRKTINMNPWTHGINLIYLCL